MGLTEQQEDACADHRVGGAGVPRSHSTQTSPYTPSLLPMHIFNSLSEEPQKTRVQKAQVRLTFHPNTGRDRGLDPPRLPGRFLQLGEHSRPPSPTQTPDRHLLPLHQPSGTSLSSSLLFFPGGCRLGLLQKMPLIGPIVSWLRQWRQPLKSNGSSHKAGDQAACLTL